MLLQNSSDGEGVAQVTTNYARDDGKLSGAAAKQVTSRLEPEPKNKTKLKKNSEENKLHN